MLWYMVTKREFRFFFKHDHLKSLSLFVATSLLMVGPTIFPLMYLMRTDPLLDAHNPKSFALDLFALFVPGETWHFSSLTEGYWSKPPVGISEASVYLGYGVLILLVYLWIKRKDVTQNNISLWYFLAGFFFLMAMGPVLQINGNIVYQGWMPYTLLEKVLPFLKLSDVPARMVVMTTVPASMLGALAIARMTETSRGKVFAFLAIAMLFIEYLPGSLPATPTSMPNYVTALANLPNDGGVLDEAAPTKYYQLYYQTAYQKPMILGYVTHTPSSVVEKEAGLRRAINRGNYTMLWDKYHIRYIVTKDVIDYESPYVSVNLVYQDGEANIYRLECKCDNGE